MAGTLIVSNLKTDTDNSFIVRSNTGTTLFVANTTGIDVANSFASSSITSDKILTVANTKISGNIISSQITSVANTQLTGTITGSQISSNTLSNTVFQTGSVENYMNSQNLGFGMRNRIINGAMVIDQRNAGASTNNAGGTTTYALDRWAYYGTSGSKFSIQQSTTAPAGFSNSILITSLAATTIGTNDEYWLNQKVEGFNSADLSWGTADAKTVTLSFWVRSSLTGTFGGSFINSANNYYYAFSYTISSANTWTQVSITVAGPTAGTWIGSTNGVGLSVVFGLSAGSTYGGATPNVWTSATYKVLPTGAVNILATNAATFYVTGVQLEAGTTATSFDYRPYTTELQLCQRYYEIIAPVQSSFLISVNATASTQEFEFLIKYLVLKRATATVTRVGTWTDSNSTGVVPLTFGTDLFCLALFSSGSGRCYIYNTGSGSCFTASAEL